MDTQHQEIQLGWLPHPAVQILVWMCLALVSQALHGIALLALFGSVVLLSLGMAAPRFFTLLRRTRWIFITLLLIYAYAMPGEPWFSQLGVFSPSREGVEDGLIQLVRLLTVLAGLAIVLTLLSTAQLIAGLYTLTYPLTCLGVPRERIAVRLALTLRYAESAMLETTKDSLRSLGNLILPMQTQPENIELQLMPLSKRDWLMLLAAVAVLLGVMP